MIRRIIAMIIAAFITVMPFSAYAARTQIKLGGTVGFMYVDSEVALKPKLKGIAAEELSWSSSDTEVARVNNGKITAHAVGRTVITVQGGGAKAKCGVVVLPKVLELDVGESFSLPYGTVEKFAVKDKSILRVSSRGGVEALREGTTYISVRYGKQNMYIKVNANGEKSEAEQSAAALLDCADSANQIVLVEYESGSSAKLSIHEKKSGVWKQLYSCSAYLGKNGIGKTREGDKKTPVGTYNLTQPFGIKADPGSPMDYTQVTKHHYWCGTSGSKYYNQMVDMREIDRKYTSSDEYLINYKGEYNYCMFIDYNKNGVEGKGSCIFLHCTGNKKSTSGCIAVPESTMKKIVQWAKPGAKIVIR